MNEKRIYQASSTMNRIKSLGNKASKLSKSSMEGLTFKPTDPEHESSMGATLAQTTGDLVGLTQTLLASLGQSVSKVITNFIYANCSNKSAV